MKFGMYIMLPEAVSTAHFINKSLSSIIAIAVIASKIFLVIALILYECVNRSS
jgi:hypothetical protein